MVGFEIDELVSLVEYRPAVMEEALTQREDIVEYFRGVLSFTQASHPATYGLAAAALRVAQFQVVHFKKIFNRVRPSRLSAGLVPPIDPPGHPAYPSGHATEAHLMALCLEQVMPEAIAQGTTVAHRPLRRMAERIARNREVLGLHYPSDSATGRKLAEKTLPLFLRCPSVGLARPDLFVADGILPDTVAGDGEDATEVPVFHPGSLIALARREWEPRR
jgi:hypothetical protein